MLLRFNPSVFAAFLIFSITPLASYALSSEGACSHALTCSLERKTDKGWVGAGSVQIECSGSVDNSVVLQDAYLKSLSEAFSSVSESLMNTSDFDTMRAYQSTQLDLQVEMSDWTNIASGASEWDHRERIINYAQNAADIRFGSDSPSDLVKKTF